MAFNFNVNNAAMTGAQAWVRMLNLWMSQGWVVKSSSDGTSFSPTGNIIVSGDAVAGGFGNSNAWFRIQMPLVGGVNREIVVQKGTNSTGYDLRYSYSAKFTSGGGVTTLPTATDQQDILTRISGFMPADNSFRFNAAAGGSADGYGSWMGCFPIGGGAPSGGVFYINPMTGSAAAGDIDPYVFVKSSAANAGAFAWYRKGNISEQFVVTHYCPFASTSGGTSIFIPNNCGVNPHTGQEQIFPVPWSSYGGNGGQLSIGSFKGISSMVCWNGSTKASGDTFSVLSTRDRFVLGDINLPWNGSVPTV